MVSSWTPDVGELKDSLERKPHLVIQYPRAWEHPTKAWQIQEDRPSRGERVNLRPPSSPNQAQAWKPQLQPWAGATSLPLALRQPARLACPATTGFHLLTGGQFTADHPRPGTRLPSERLIRCKSPHRPQRKPAASAQWLLCVGCRSGRLQAGCWEALHQPRACCLGAHLVPRVLPDLASPCIPPPASLRPAMELASCQAEPSSPLSEEPCGLGSSFQVLVSPCDLGLVPPPFHLRGWGTGALHRGLWP